MNIEDFGWQLAALRERERAFRCFQPDYSNPLGILDELVFYREFILQGGYESLLLPRDRAAVKAYSVVLKAVRAARKPRDRVALRSIIASLSQRDRAAVKAYKAALKAYHDFVLEIRRRYDGPKRRRGILRVHTQMALQVRRHYLQYDLPDVHILPSGATVGLNDFLRMEQWFQDASKIVCAAEKAHLAQPAQKANEQGQAGGTAGSQQTVGMTEIQQKIDLAIRLIEQLNREKERHARRRKKLLDTESPGQPLVVRNEHLVGKWGKNGAPLIGDIQKLLGELRPYIVAHWSASCEERGWGTFSDMIDYGKDDYEQWKASGWADIHIQELQAVSRALASIDQKSNGLGQARETAAGAGKGTQRKQQAKKSNLMPKKSRGRPRKYSDATCKKARKQFDDFFAQSNDAFAAWNKVADNLEFSSAEAARKACERYQQSQNSGQNGHN